MWFAAICDPDNVEAEFAIVVRSDLKGAGLGRLLLGRMLDYLRAHGTRRVVGDVLRENRAMRELARSLGFRTDPAASDASQLRVVLDLDAAAAGA